MPRAGRPLPLPTSGTAAAVLCAWGIVASPAVGAVEGISLSLASVEGSGWSAAGMELRLRPVAEGGIAASVTVERLSLPEPLGAVQGITFRCDRLAISGQSYRCDAGTAKLRNSPLQDRPFTVAVRYDRGDRRLVVETPDLPWHGMDFALRAEWSENAWSAEASAAELDATRLHGGLQQFAAGLATLDVAAGVAGFSAAASGDASGLRAASLELAVESLELSNETGTLAAAGLDASLRVTAARRGEVGTVDYTLGLRATGGEAYAEPVYLDLVKAPVEFGAVGGWEPGRLRLASFDLQHRGALRTHGDAVIELSDEARLTRARAEIVDARFPGVYAAYLQGFLIGTPVAKLETSGRVTGRIAVADGELTLVDLRLHDLHADDAEGRLAIYGASGVIAWDRRPQGGSRRSRLAWDGGFVYALGFGAGEAALRTEARRVSLQGGLRVPVLDGALIVDTFEARGLGGESPEVVFDARLEPLSLARVTTALGWPALPGKLSGELPLLSVSEGELTLGGELTARVFDGTISIADLRIERPFGADRRSSADVTLENLDLGLVTDVFTFGRIEGRLDGSVRGLRLLQGRPIAFDASFYTPPDDDSRRLISRRALSNLSEIAGAGTALLSGGFLGLFQEFRYETLGISCELEGDLCRMSGVEPAETGYYLVKGSGLPRIDVIGHSREVNWPRLVAQIAEALRSREVTTAAESEAPR